jgi:uncharacterized SAM-binding protein YcdF (DUF218 family)
MSSTSRAADAIVVLGCRVEPDGRLSAAAARRCEAAARGYREGRSEIVLCSGGRKWDGHVEALRLRDHLRALGVPERAILVELCSFTTAENAIYSAEILRHLTGRAAPRAAVATCEWHQPRARANFERVGVTVEPLVPDEPAAPAAVRAKRWVHEAMSLRLDLANLHRAGQRGGAFLPSRGARS